MHLQLNRIVCIFVLQERVHNGINVYEKYF